MRDRRNRGDGADRVARIVQRLDADIAIVGGGPAGLMAAETALARGRAAHVFDAMPSVGRKFLMAGKSGLNLTHSEPLPAFLSRFGRSEAQLGRILSEFPPEALRSWAAELGVETFVGSSGRVFPIDFKAAPLLRAWLRRLRAQGAIFHVGHRWIGWERGGRLLFETRDGPKLVRAGATILALGGASWPRLGSDGGWTEPLSARNVRIAPLRPANCGFEVGWSDHFRERFAGRPVKPVVLTGATASQRGEFIVTAAGIEGSGVYAHAAGLRDEIERTGAATLTLDLLPDHDLERLVAALAAPRGGRSLAEHLRRAAGLTGVKAGLLRECLPPEAFADPAGLANGIKALRLRLIRPRPIAEAISTAGGIAWEELDDNLMLRVLPGVFAAGEMIDWEVTTGGYLLTACVALGRQAGTGAVAWLAAAGKSDQ